jgi:hypothetical protein
MLACLAGAPAALADGEPRLTVQKEWKLLAVGVAVDPDLDLLAVVRSTEQAMRRELPGIDLHFDLERYRAFPRPGKELNDRALVRHGMRAAEDAGIDLADYDICFVFSPLYKERYFGFSHVSYRTQDKATSLGAAIQTAPAKLLYSGMVDALDGRHPEGFKPEEPGPLSKRLSGTLSGLLKRNKERLLGALELPYLREAIISPTIAHEFGHFLAPGDPDIRDGYQKPWLKHATGPEDNPENHTIDCCMYKGRSLDFYAKKALRMIRMGGRLVVFCDNCRAKLGCAKDAAPPAETPKLPPPAPATPF